jgi:uncharacterized protein YecT (DUF1311 family)
MKRLACAVVLISVICSPAAWASGKPSFDCAKARTAVEKAICADGGLAEQDASIAKHFGKARMTFDPATGKALTEDQRWFVQVRDEAFASPPGNETPQRELADRLKYRDAFLMSLVLKRRQGFEGDWENLAGGISIKREPDGRLSFDGSAAHPENGRWVCDVRGLGDVKNNAMVVETVDADGWTLTLSRKGYGLVLSESPPAGTAEATGRPYCGLNGALGGVYYPVSRP